MRSLPRFVVGAAVFLAAVLPDRTDAQAIARANPAPTDMSDVAIVWEQGTDLICSWAPPEAPDNAFTFTDGNRWSTTATDGGGLQRGDPTTITWGIVPDGTSISGFIGEPSSPSDLIAFLDSLYGAGPGGSDLTQRPWFPLFELIFTVWGDLIGLDYVYEPNDDGVALATIAGSLGVRADVRVSGHFIDGESGSNTLAYNFFPNGGDMVIDTSNPTFYGNTTNNSRGLRNVLAHEHGHGLGISHVCPIGLGRLMEPFIDTSFDGPQEDDILAGNRGYGDRDEFPGENDTSGTGTSFGAPAVGGSILRTILSVDGTSDQDFYAFSAPADVLASVTLTPTGSTYLSGPQTGGSCTPGTTFDALVESDLGVELRGLSGSNILASADAFAAGIAETIVNEPLTEGAGTYFVRVFGANDKAQMYELNVGLTAEADLSITKTDSSDPATVGSSLTYTVTVTNAGPAPAQDVVVADTLPAEVSFVSTTGCTEDPGGVPTCSLGTIASGAMAQYTVVVTVDSGAGGTITNQVSVTSSTTDPNAGNNSTIEDTTISGAACFTDLNLQSQTVNTTTTFEASNSITARNAFVVGSTGVVDFNAGSLIALGDGFSVDSGGQFTAAIDPLITCP